VGAVYVDDASIPARVANGRVVHDYRWSHLFADTQQELHAFAAKLGLCRPYFQPGRPRRDGSPSPHWHYDLTAGKRQQAIRLLTAGKRQQAIRLGTQPVTSREAIEIIAAREAQAEQALMADEAAHTTGLAFRAGEYARAARWLAAARLADPSRAPLWHEYGQRVASAARALQIVGPDDPRPLGEIVAARLQAAGIGPNEHALRFTRAWNAQQFAAAQQQPQPGDGVGETGPGPLPHVGGRRGAGGRVMTAALPAARLAVRGVSPAHISVSGARLRVRALIAMGHSTGRIAHALGHGASARAVRRMARGDTTAIAPGLRRLIGRLYEHWWDLVPPERTPAERDAAAAARRWAKRRRWCTGAGLDDDELDQPGYEPYCGWRPATGTGIATDNPLKERAPTPMTRRPGRNGTPGPGPDSPIRRGAPRPCTPPSSPHRRTPP
jgi:Protein of unknown function (DUF4031)